MGSYRRISACFPISGISRSGTPTGPRSAGWSICRGWKRCTFRRRKWRIRTGADSLPAATLRYLHGMRDVFKSAAAREYMRLRPEVRVDQGIPADLEKHPEIKEYFEALNRDKGN